MTVPGGYVAGDVLTAANMNLLPGPLVSSAYTGSSQTGISAATALTSLTLTFTAVAGRRYQIEGIVNFRQRTSGGLVSIEICKAATTVLMTARASYATDEYGTQYLFYTEVPGAGSVTYNLRAKTTAGTVDINPDGLSTLPSGIIVKDVGN